MRQLTDYYPPDLTTCSPKGRKWLFYSIFIVYKVRSLPLSFDEQMES